MDSRMGTNPIFTDNWKSISHCNRQPKQLLKLRKPPVPAKELLQYRGPRCNSDNKNMSTHSSNTSSDYSESLSDSDKSSTRSNDSLGGRSTSLDFFCEVCYNIEAQRRNAVGQAPPSVMEHGPWFSHPARDEQGIPTCPVLFFGASNVLMPTGNN